MKKKGFCHLDIKCENILLDDKINVKIGDFGYAQPAQPNSEDVEQERCSPFHKAPEICK